MITLPGRAGTNGGSSAPASSAVPPTAVVSANGIALASASAGQPVNGLADGVSTLPLRPLAMATEEDMLSPLQRALRALDMLWHLFERAREMANERGDVPALASSPSSGALHPTTGSSGSTGETAQASRSRDFFYSYWRPVLTGLSANASHPIRAIRLHAITLLQRLLIVPELATLAPLELAVCFNEVCVRPRTENRDTAATNTVLGGE